MLNIFANDAFGVVSMTRAIQGVPFVPNLLGQLGIFEPMPVATNTVAIERLGNTLSLVPTSARGAPPTRIAEDKRSVRDVSTVRLATGERIYASQVNGVRAFGSETELQTMQNYAMQRMARLRQNIEATWENLRLGAIRGVVVDADGTTVIQNWFTFWGISEPSAINFALSTDTTDVNGKCTEVIRTMQKNGEGAFLPTTRVFGLCGDAFWDSLVSHPNVQKFFLNRPAADTYLNGTAYQVFNFGGITFLNYRGTDDGTTVGIATNDCRFIPVGADNVFQMALSPMGESEFFVNTLGLPIYAMQVPDRDRGFWTDVEVYSYPLPICTRPRMLLRGTRTA